MLRPGRIVVWVLLGLVLAGVAALWKELSREQLGASEYGLLVRLIVYRVVALAAAMFTTVVISQEIEQKTIVYLVTRTVPRNALIFSRGLAAVAAVTLMSWISLILVGLVLLGPSMLTSGMFWMDMFIMLLGAVAYASLFIFITLIMNRAMLLILIFTFVWEAFVPYLKGDMYLLTVNTYMSVLAQHPDKAKLMAVTAMQSDSAGVNPVFAWIILPLVGVGFLILSGWWFSKFQYLPREDAE
jgi:ABC-2 type transport system permease protein